MYPPRSVPKERHSGRKARSHPSGKGLEPFLLTLSVNPDSSMASNGTTNGVKRHVKPPDSSEGRVQRAIARIAESDCAVLIVGERGVGKRSIAAQIHAGSSRAHGTFR